MRRISTGASWTPIKKCPGTHYVGSSKYCSYIPHGMFNLQAGVLEKSRSCFRMQKFTTAASQTEKPRRYPISVSDAAYVSINKRRPTYLCQKQTLRSSTFTQEKNTEREREINTQLGSHGTVSPPHPPNDCHVLSCVCFYNLD
jgi:hypothetical protein